MKLILMMMIQRLVTVLKQRLVTVVKQRLVTVVKQRLLTVVKQRLLTVVNPWNQRDTVRLCTEPHSVALCRATLCPMDSMDSPQ